MKLDKVKIAHYFADALENYLHDGYGELISDLKVGPKAKEWLRDTVRWTLIDDETGQNLLESDADKAKRELQEKCVLAVKHFLNREMPGADADTVDQVVSLYQQFKRLGVKP